MIVGIAFDNYDDCWQLEENARVLTIERKTHLNMEVEGSLLCGEAQVQPQRAPRLSLCPLSINGPSSGRCGPGLHNGQEPHPAGEIAGAGGTPAFPEGGNQVGRSTDRGTPTENPGGREREGRAGGAGGLPAWGLTLLPLSLRKAGQAPPGPGLAQLPLHREAVAGPARAGQTRGRWELWVPDPCPHRLRPVLDLAVSLWALHPTQQGCPLAHPWIFLPLTQSISPTWPEGGGLLCHVHKFSSCLTSVFPSYLHFLIWFSICSLHRGMSLWGKGRLSCL